MPAIHTLILFSGVALLFAASPGPNFFFVLTKSLGGGRRMGQRAVFGIGTGALIHTALAVFGLSALLQASEVIYLVIKFSGAAYLVYLGIAALRAPASHAPTNELTRGNAYRDGLITMLFNPKAALYFFAFLPQFVDPSLGHANTQLVVFGSIQCLAAVVVYTVVTLAAGWVRAWVSRYQQQIRRGSGLAYIGLGAWVAFGGSGR